MRLLLLLLAAGCLWADERTDRLIARLGEEAEAFQRLAPQVLGTEQLHQRAPAPPRRFRLRVGAAAHANNEPEWQERDIVSEYAFTTFADGALHELRQVVSVDGKKEKESGKASERLAAVITASDEGRKKELLKQFERHGLVGAATDFGQYILLFTPRNIESFEFAFLSEAQRHGEDMHVFSYKQVDGPEALTVVDANRDQTRSLSIEGLIYVRESNYQPATFTLSVVQSLGAEGIRQEAEIEYEMSPYGALLPASVHHRDLRGMRLVAENSFQYSSFRKFGASSEITFEPQSGGK